MVPWHLLFVSTMWLPGYSLRRQRLMGCLEYLREGDTLLVIKLDRLARSTPDLYRIVSELTPRGVVGEGEMAERVSAFFG